MVPCTDEQVSQRAQHLDLNKRNYRFISSLTQQEEYYLCPDTTNFVVQGSFSSTKFKHVTLSIIACNQKNNCADDQTVNQTILNFKGIHSTIEYNQAEGKMQILYATDYRSTIPVPLDTSQTKTLDMFFSHSQINNVEPLGEYTGTDTGQIKSFFELKHVRQF